jgi:hypothetical protein
MLRGRHRFPLGGPVDVAKIGALSFKTAPHHARLERLYCEVAWQMVDVHDRPVAALPPLHIERANAVLAHVGEVHRLDRIIGAGAAIAIKFPRASHCRAVEVL